MLEPDLDMWIVEAPERDPDVFPSVIPPWLRSIKCKKIIAYDINLRLELGIGLIVFSRLSVHSQREMSVTEMSRDEMSYTPGWPSSVKAHSIFARLNFIKY